MITNVESKKSVSAKPWWWKSLWVTTLLLTIAIGATKYFHFHIPIERVAGGLALTFVMIGISYYIRIKPSRRVNRGVYVLLGISPIGFCLWYFMLSSGIGRLLTIFLGHWLSLIIGFTVPLIMGAFVGDWIGKRRNYRLPLSP